MSKGSAPRLFDKERRNQALFVGLVLVAAGAVLLYAKRGVYNLDGVLSVATLALMFCLPVYLLADKLGWVKQEEPSQSATYPEGADLSQFENPYDVLWL